MSEGAVRTRLIKAMIALELVCLLLIAWPSYVTLTWYGPENFGLLALIFVGGPALIVQLIAMIVALRRTSDLDSDDPSRSQFQWWAATPVAIAMALFGWVYVAEMA